MLKPTSHKRNGMSTEVQGNSRLEKPDQMREGSTKGPCSLLGAVAGEVDRSLASLFVKAPICTDRWRYPATAVDAARRPTAAQVPGIEESDELPPPPCLGRATCPSKQNLARKVDLFQKLSIAWIISNASQPGIDLKVPHPSITLPISAIQPVKRPICISAISVYLGDLVCHGLLVVINQTGQGGI
jgi:hypothetical protein